MLLAEIRRHRKNTPSTQCHVFSVLTYAGLQSGPRVKTECQNHHVLPLSLKNTPLGVKKRDVRAIN